MVAIKQAKRNRSNKNNEHEDDEFVKFMKSFGFEFDGQGRITKNPFNYNMRRKENEKE